jgi:hypothetical protein
MIGLSSSPSESSAGAAYAVEFLDSSFRTPRDVIDVLGIPVVAAVPEQRRPSPKRSLGALYSLGEQSNRFRRPGAFVRERCSREKRNRGRYERIVTAARTCETEERSHLVPRKHRL